MVAHHQVPQPPPRTHHSLITWSSYAWLWFLSTKLHSTRDYNGQDSITPALVCCQVTATVRMPQSEQSTAGTVLLNQKKVARHATNSHIATHARD